MDQYIEAWWNLIPVEDDEPFQRLNFQGGGMGEYDNWRDSTVARIVLQDFHSIDSW